MNKKILLAVGIGAVLVAVVMFFWPSRVEIENLPPKNGTILIFGDSLAEGTGANVGGDLTSLLSAQLGKTVLNYGRSGDTTRDGVRRLQGALEEDPGLVVIILGGNDFLKKIPTEETFRNLKTIITGFQAGGAATVLVGVRSGVFGDGRGEEFETLAEETGFAYIPDILDDVFADSRYMSDAVHPNDAGYARIAERIAPILAGLYGAR